jgi:tetratricopeptide (TPR) repeat protein
MIRGKTMKRLHGIGLFVAASAVVVPAFACTWDKDTLDFEEEYVPHALELLTGKFLRHSDEFYQWRILDRTQKLESQPGQLPLYDDLSVAYLKTGDTRSAIEVIQKKERLHPDLYETHANLGTFYIFDGQLEEGVKHVKRAIEINPDAHFGREIYQQALVEYAISRKKDGQLKLPLRVLNVLEEKQSAPKLGVGFGHYIQASELSKAEEARKVQHAKALTGVMGMMRFAKHDNPLVLEALGDLLAAVPEGSQNATASTQLAARAYLKASYAVSDPEAKTKYWNMAEHYFELWRDGSTRLSQPGVVEKIDMPLFEAMFKSEIDEGTEWFEKVRADEIAWISQGRDVEAEFDKKYHEDPKAVAHTAAVDYIADAPARAAHEAVANAQLAEQVRNTRALIVLLSLALVGVVVFAGRALWKQERQSAAGNAAKQDVTRSVTK